MPILLIPAYRQKLKQEAPTLRSVQRWSDSTLQDCYQHVDWDMYATIKTFPNQKPWIDGSIRVKLKARTTAFNQGKVTGNMTEYKQADIPSARL